jgi:hypothetical protein
MGLFLVRFQGKRDFLAVVRQNSDRHSNQRVGRSARFRVCPYDTEVMLCLLRSLGVLFIRVFRSRSHLLLENLALRQQLLGLKKRHPRPQVSNSDKLFWVILRQFWPEWRHALILVHPETVVRWHRAGFKLYWTWLSRRRVRAGRKCISKELRELIFRLVAENSMGRTADPRRTEDAWLRSFGANRVALDAESAEVS